MGIQDDYFDIRNYLEGTIYEETFDGFSRWAFRLEEEGDKLFEENAALRKAIRVLDSPPLREDERTPRRDEVEISVPISDPAGVGGLSGFFVDPTGRVDEGILARYGEKGPLVLVSATRDGGIMRFRLRRPE